MLLDENISHKVVKSLQGIYPGTTHIRYNNLVSSPDIAVWEFAKEHGLCIVSFDADFESIFMCNGFPPKIIRIARGRLRIPSSGKCVQGFGE